MTRLTEKVAIVTGAGSGIGAETARVLAENGAKVAVSDINIDNANKVVKEIKDSGGEAIAVLTDVTDEDSVKNLIKTVKDTFGKIDILHNNAGGTPKTDKDIASLDMETFQKSIDLNLKGVTLGIKHVLAEMISNGGGSIINTASGSGILGDFGASTYGAAKAGIISLTRYADTQYGRQGIRCNSIAPGFIQTPATETLGDDQIGELMKSHSLLGRNGTPRDIANTVLFLASDESSFLTGQTLAVDGGMGSHQPYYADFMKGGAAW